jgi:hypothetical protein
MAQGKNQKVEHEACRHAFLHGGTLLGLDV